MPGKDTSGARDSAKNVRTVRALTTQLRWLEWPLFWTGNKPEFRKGAEAVSPTPDTLAKAQRNLYKIFEYKNAARKVLSDPDSWKDERNQLLETAKYVSGLGQPDFEKLLRASKERNTSFLPQLADLIELEAIVVNSLPESPSRMLQRFGPTAAPVLEAILKNPRKRIESRALAALCIGAIDKEENRRERTFPANEPHAAWLMRSYRWGYESQLRIDPQVSIAILKRSDGRKLLTQLSTAIENAVSLPLSVDVLKHLVVQDELDAERVVSAYEALNKLEPTMQRLMTYRHELPADDVSTRKIKGLRLEKQRRTFAREFKGMLEKYTLKAPSPAVLDAIARFLNYLLSRFYVDELFLAEILSALRNGLSLENQLLVPYFELIQSQTIWDIDKPKQTRVPRRNVRFNAFTLTEYQGQIAPQVGIPVFVYPNVSANEGMDERIERSNQIGAMKNFTIWTGSHTVIFSHRQIDFRSVVVTRHSQKVDVRGLIKLVYSNFGVSNLSAVATLLGQSKDPHLVRLTQERGITPNLAQAGITEQRSLKLALNIIDRLDLNTTLDISQLCYLLRTFSDPAEAHEHLAPIVDEIERLPFSLRQHYFEALDSARKSRKSFKKSLDAIGRFLPYLIEATANDASEDCTCTSLVCSAIEIAFHAPKHEKVLFQTLTSLYKNKRPMNWEQMEAVTSGCLLGLALIKAGVKADQIRTTRTAAGDIDPAAVMSDAIDIFLSHKYEDDSFLRDGLHSLRDYPAIAYLVARQYKRHPKRVSKLIERIGIAKKFGSDAMKPLDKLARYKDVFRCKKNDRHTIKRIYAKGWRNVLILAPDLVPQMLSYTLSKSITGGAQTPPGIIDKLISTRENLQKERAHLKELVKKNPDRQDMAQRLSNLDERLNKRGDDVVIYSAKMIRKHLNHLVLDAEMEALETIVQEVFLKQLKRINGTLPRKVLVDNYLINALLLTQDISLNKRLLKKLIRSHVAGDHEWRMRIPANQAFVENLKKRGGKPDVWFGQNAKTYQVKEIKGETVTLRLETDPLKVLEMGNYFDTCLSFKGVNSYATVVNATDLNKRVIYAYDKNGTVIARQLIGISETGEMVGFRVYTAEAALNEVFSEYARDLAAKANIELADDGSVPVLSTKYWYDDGIIPWVPVKPAPAPEPAR